MGVCGPRSLYIFIYIFMWIYGLDCKIGTGICIHSNIYIYNYKCMEKALHVKKRKHMIEYYWESWAMVVYDIM